MNPVFGKAKSPLFLEREMQMSTLSTVAALQSAALVAATEQANLCKTALTSLDPTLAEKSTIEAFKRVYKTTAEKAHEEAVESLKAQFKALKEFKLVAADVEALAFTTLGYTPKVKKVKAVVATPAVAEVAPAAEVA